MPPHARMSAAQMLLVRALVSRFWRKPYSGRLARWGTELHDRFMLPHYVEADLQEVVADLQEAGYPFQLDWLNPFFEFRFPRYGTARVDDIELELRMAIEPWHVLGEEVSSFGTSRYVDSSVERVQVKVSGLNGDRYVVTCNGSRVPLRSTGTAGEYVAGVRYQAWQPPSSLHPTIGVHSPLGLRHLRHLERPRNRRLHLPRLPSRRPRPRGCSGQRQRGGIAPHRPLLGLWTFAKRGTGPTWLERSPRRLDLLTRRIAGRAEGRSA